jgi:synaptic vesicle membrane protein VAT-1
MRALVVRRYGPPQNLEIQQAPDPQPKPGEALIRVRAIGVNFADLLQRMGLYPTGPKPPFVPGLELAGVVERIGDPAKSAEATGFRVGDAVIALMPSGAYAEWAVAPVKQIFRVPPGISFEDAAAIPVNYLTAYHAMFTLGNLQPGERVLIHAAAGGVGIAAIQLARQRGVITFGVAGPTKQDFLRKLGVDHPIDYERSDFVDVVQKYAPGGIELAMDPIGGKSFQRSFDCLGPDGRLMVYGFSAAAASTSNKKDFLLGAKAYFETPRFHPLKLLEKGVGVIGVNLGALQQRPAVLRHELDELFRMYAAGQIRPVIAKKFLLEQGVDAHQYIHARKNVGKVILALK